MKHMSTTSGARAWLVALLSLATAGIFAGNARADEANVRVAPAPQQQPQSPTCPNGYAWDEASGRCQARQGAYATPMQQTTQATYVPQSVAMSGPRVIKDWHEGDPVPDGYHITQRARVGMVVGGAVTFGVLYLISVLIAAADHDLNSSVGGTDNMDAFFIPGIGPFLQMSKTSSATGNVFNVIDGVAQCGGIAMVVVGLTDPKNVLVRNDLAKTMILPAPYVSAHGGGIGLVGRF